MRYIHRYIGTYTPIVETHVIEDLAGCRRFRPRRSLLISSLLSAAPFLLASAPFLLPSALFLLLSAPGLLPVYSRFSLAPFSSYQLLTRSLFATSNLLQKMTLESQSECCDRMIHPSYDENRFSGLSLLLVI